MVGGTRGKRLCCNPLHCQALPWVLSWVPCSLTLNEAGSGCVTSMRFWMQREVLPFWLEVCFYLLSQN